MRHRHAFFVVLAALEGLAPLAVSCAAQKESPAPLPISDAPDSSRVHPDSSVDAAPPDDSATPDAAGGPGRVYASTADTLYLFEPISGDLKEVGKFSCLNPADSLDYVFDIAVDRTGSMFATTPHRFLRVDPATASCSEIAKATGQDYFPSALSFVPSGTVDPTKEALVGYAALGTNPNATDFVWVDSVTGVMTKLGDMNVSDAGTQYKASGDLISLLQDGNRAYSTVVAIGGSGSTLLAEVNPNNGSIKRIIGDTKEPKLYGLGYWAGKGYGFSGSGRIVEVNMATGASTLVKTVTGDGGVGLAWYGAGVTTQAPIQ
jgi:hypothetical protein